MCNQMAQYCMLPMCPSFFLGCVVKEVLGQLGQAMFVYHAMVKATRKRVGRGPLDKMGWWK